MVVLVLKIEVEIFIWRNCRISKLTWHASFPPSGYPAHIIPSVTFNSLYVIHRLHTSLFKTGTWTSFTASSYSEAMYKLILLKFSYNFNSRYFILLRRITYSQYRFSFPSQSQCTVFQVLDGYQLLADRLVLDVRETGLVFPTKNNCKQIFLK